eukprot:SAG25_NODE_709_length_5824_cov_4.561048_6_plen_124_part_01
MHLLVGVGFSDKPRWVKVDEARSEFRREQLEKSTTREPTLHVQDRHCIEYRDLQLKPPRDRSSDYMYCDCDLKLLCTRDLIARLIARLIYSSRDSNTAHNDAPAPSAATLAPYISIIIIIHPSI